MSILRRSREVFNLSQIPIKAGRGDSENPPKTWNADYTLREHHHDFEEIVVIAAGRGLHCIDGRNYKVNCGDVFVIKEGHSHYFHHREKMIHLNFAYNFKVLPMPAELLGRLDGFRALFEIEPSFRKDRNSITSLHLSPKQLQQVVNLHQGMRNEEIARKPGFESMMFSLFLEFVIFISRTYSGITTVHGRQILSMEKVIRNIDLNYSRKISIREMCRIANMSKPAFMRCFKSSTGLTPNRYLNSIRIGKAEELLVKGGGSMTEIAANVGFSNSNYFARAFRAFKELSPKQYRKKYR